ncbi:NADPH-dependent FMN reductase [Mesoterricola silvestris]|uniref:NAD(P)H-dependent oxidoreductase n=1 Tax=Mesoterricola silvestris TaxID=2927979 RepID=A0AA48H521_9BACT|nr:NADPH-dependent FMN reductase [Mesoterricola silvestris]BDU72003.1 NAD(P)H-dependent oxidoreductase [Mesoterricola silvestris]
MKIAIMGGSLRKDSLNLRLLGHLARTLAALGPKVRIAAGNDLRIPLYDADAPPPPGAVSLHNLLADSQGLVIVSPEYNAGIPAHLKNALDWVSTMRPSPFQGLPVLLASASPGAFGGARAQMQWRATLANLGAVALPAGITVPLADRNLDADGVPQDPRTAAEVQKVLAAFLDLTGRLGARP